MRDLLDFVAICEMQLIISNTKVRTSIKDKLFILAHR